MIAIPIRTAEARDLAAITRIYEHAVRHGTASFELEPPSEREMGRRYEALRSGGYPYLVAQLEREIMGNDEDANVIEPPALREAILRKARGILANPERT